MRRCDIYAEGFAKACGTEYPSPTPSLWFLVGATIGRPFGLLQAYANTSNYHTTQFTKDALLRYTALRSSLQRYSS